MYKFHERAKANDDFRDCFKISIKPFYDSLITVISKKICIDPFKLDDFLHEKFGNYEDYGKSMQDIVIENYGEKAIKLLKDLL